MLHHFPQPLSPARWMRVLLELSDKFFLSLGPERFLFPFTAVLAVRGSGCVFILRISDSVLEFKLGHSQSDGAKDAGDSLRLSQVESTSGSILESLTFKNLRRCRTLN